MRKQHIKAYPTHRSSIVAAVACLKRLIQEAANGWMGAGGPDGGEPFPFEGLVSCSPELLTTKRSPRYFRSGRRAFNIPFVHERTKQRISEEILSPVKPPLGQAPDFAARDDAMLGRQLAQAFDELELIDDKRARAGYRVKLIELALKRRGR